jgi:LPXTG-site transpeptidase (sortase) family protein
METPNDNTLSIRPLGPGGKPGWEPEPQPANNPEAASEARLKIENVAKPAYQGSTPTSMGASARLAYPNPISPAAQELRQMPAIPKIPRHFSKLKPILSALAAFLFILMLFKAPVLYTQIKFIASGPNQNEQIAPPANNAVAESVPPDPTITIPKINVHAPIVYPTSTANSPNYDPELENGVVHYPNTAKPGEAGNIVLFGHSSNDWWQPGNYKFVFVLLDKLVPGDTFSINHNSKRYIYQVTDAKVVEANDLSVLAPSNEPIVTLITCWPAGTSLKRQITIAKQISPSVGSSATPTPSSSPSSTPVLPGSSPSLWQQLQQFIEGVKDGISNKPATVTGSAHTLPNSN